MMGSKKLSTIRAELKAAIAKEGVNPIAALDRKLRKLAKSAPVENTPRALILLRGALAQLAEDVPKRRARTARSRRARKAV